MWHYNRHLFQLLLAPSRGWEDSSESGNNYEEAQRRGYLPLIGIAAVSEFLQLLYSPTLTFLGALGSAIAIFGGLFASVYAARLFLDILVTRMVNPKANVLKINILSVYMMGLDSLYLILANCLPAQMTFLYFLPLVSLLVLFKSTAYINVPDDRIVNYLIICCIGVIAIPIAICAMFLLIL